MKRNPFTSIFVLLAFFLCSGLVAVAESPALKLLEGTWVSDREGTIAWMKQSGKFSKTHIDVMTPLVGTLRVTYKGNTALLDSVSGGAARKLLFRVVRENGNTIEIEAVLLPPEGQAVDWSKGYTSRIEIGDGDLWVSQPADPSGLRERLVRVPAAGS